MNQKVIVITGAGSGLGAALAKKYADMGYHICLLGRTKEKLEKAAKAFAHQQHSIYPIDVARKENVHAVFQQIQEDAGPVDILINNAGIGVFEKAEKLTEMDIDQMIDINIKGTIFCTQEVLPSMKERNAGTIANIISTAGLEGKATESVYCASKFGVRGFTESLAVELQDTELHIFGAYMGGMKTPFWEGTFEAQEMEHLMHPDDIADIIIDNITMRKKLNVEQVVIKNHGSR